MFNNVYSENKLLSHGFSIIEEEFISSDSMYLPGKISYITYAVHYFSYRKEIKFYFVTYDEPSVLKAQWLSFDLFDKKRTDKEANAKRHYEDNSYPGVQVDQGRHIAGLVGVNETLYALVLGSDPAKDSELFCWSLKLESHFHKLSPTRIRIITKEKLALDESVQFYMTAGIGESVYVVLTGASGAIFVGYFAEGSSIVEIHRLERLKGNTIANRNILLTQPYVEPNNNICVHEKELKEPKERLVIWGLDRSSARLFRCIHMPSIKSNELKWYPLISKEVSEAAKAMAIITIRANEKFALPGLELYEKTLFLVSSGDGGAIIALNVTEEDAPIQIVDSFMRGQIDVLQSIESVFLLVGNVEEAFFGIIRLPCLKQDEKFKSMTSHAAPTVSSDS